MKIGFTERGDAGLDLSWADRLDGLDGVVLITKNANRAFADRLRQVMRPGKFILHAGCTGLGKTPLEPNVPDPDTQLDYVSDLVELGFPLDHVVVRVDPIIPTQATLARAAYVIDGARRRGLLVPGMRDSARLRISVYDEYRHVKARLAAQGIAPVYPGDRFQASDAQLESVLDMLEGHAADIQVETCAEPKFVEMARTRGLDVVARGCLSETDLALMRIDASEAPSARNAQMRHGCLCLSCKVELLRHRRQCPHKCVYCYWRDDA